MINKKLCIISKGILKIPFLSIFLGIKKNFLWPWYGPNNALIAGWGYRNNTKWLRWYANFRGFSYIALEDGFVRSFGTGEKFPPLSLIVDEYGIYYDCSKPSTLECLLCKSIFIEDAAVVRKARKKLVTAGLSKYNHAPVLPIGLLRSSDTARVLVVDQTSGDMSVILGAADAATFQAMLVAALSENPQATIYVKTHPEVSSGRKGGYLTNVQSDARTVVLRNAVNPSNLIENMDKVYVVSSTMGFEALLMGKPVVCFGVPWYAGWGVTDDRQPQHPAMMRRAVQRRTVDDLFAAGYMQYARYLNPETYQLGSLFDVMDWLVRQRKMAQRFSGRMIVVGFRRWKAENVKPMLSLHADKVIFAKNTSVAAALQPKGEDCLVCWGRVLPVGIEELAAASSVRLLRMEDGFVRSVGLGSDLIPPRSFVLDAKGIYFDPAQPSELEDLLNTHVFTSQDMQRAHWVRNFIVHHGITKYNLEPLQIVNWLNEGRQVVLVPGQVEDDASIRFGCDTSHGVHTNLGLLQAARKAYPQAFIVYKPHPDVMSGNRLGKLALRQAWQWADHVENQASVVSCIESCNTVVTMTSLTGFDALLRGKKVVVHGRPFYAGWGLTQDMLQMPRRHRKLKLDELVAGALLHYPLYWDPQLKGYTSCEAVLRQLLEQRRALERNGNLQALRVGYVRRQWRKLKVLMRTALSS